MSRLGGSGGVGSGWVGLCGRVMWLGYVVGLCGRNICKYNDYKGNTTIYMQLDI